MERVKLKHKWRLSPINITAGSCCCAISDKRFLINQPTLRTKIEMLLRSSAAVPAHFSSLDVFEVTGLRQHAGFTGSRFSHSSSPFTCGYPGLLPVFPIWESFPAIDCCWVKLRSYAWLTFLDYYNLFLKTMLSSKASLPLLGKVGATGCAPETTSGCQLKPNPAPLGLCVARIGSVMPLPSGPRPMPGLQPMLCNIRLPMLVSGMGAALSPTNPERKVQG